MLKLIFSFGLYQQLSNWVYDLAAVDTWWESPVSPHPKGALLDCDVVIAEAVWVQ